MQDWWLRLKLRLKSINIVVMRRQPYFFQKNTYFGIDNVLANSKLSMHCSARCRDQNVFFGLRNVEADKRKWIRIQETPETPETPFLFVCFFSVLDFSHVNVNRLFQFACKVSILIVNGYQFERSKGVALRFSFFTGLDATRLPSSQNLQFHILPMSFTNRTMVFHIERIWDVKLFGNWISYVVQNPG